MREERSASILQGKEDVGAWERGGAAAEVMPGPAPAPTAAGVVGAGACSLPHRPPPFFNRS